MALGKSKSVTERPAEKGHTKDYGHGNFTEDTGGNRTIYVQSNKLWNDMVEYAATQGISRSECISRAILAYITQDKECPICKRTREILMAGSQSVVRKGKK